VSTVDPEAPRLKVLLLSTGFREYMICLANALSARAEVTLAAADRLMTPRHRSLLVPAVNYRPFTYVDYRSARRNARMLLDLLRAIRREQPDILHIQSNGFRLFWLLYPFLRRYAIVNTVHDPAPHSGDEASPRLPRAERAAARNCRAFFVHGAVLRGELRDQYSVPESRIHVVPHGEFSIYQNWRVRSVTPHPADFLFFGRIWPYKGLDVFIRAANEVARALPSARFTIAGAGEDFARYQALIEDPSRFDVRNFRIEEEILDEVFQRCRAVVLPYTDATQSGVIPIAYAYGKPVIATRVGALPEVVVEGKTGYLVEPRDPGAIATRMLDMASDETAYADMCAAALRFAREELDWGLVAAKSVEVYRQVLGLR
jgi:alpha-maltose-1-phosphate synthase